MSMDTNFRGWPAWATWVAGERQGRESGVGDTLERLLGSGGRLTKQLLVRLGVDCGCCGRRDRLNLRYPYEQRIDHG